jgi:MurNAc alpha-1-phosphate uridylyltransferase
MKAMILAAGLGKRMQPLTNFTPKPLLKVADRFLIEFHLEKLAKAGIQEVVVNTHHLAEQIPTALGSGEKWGLNIHYSHEPELLETAGGIRQALGHLIDDDTDPFLLINGDVYFEWDLSEWLEQAKATLNNKQACLVLIPNPEHHPEGDFCFQDKSKILCLKSTSFDKNFTYSGIGLYRGSFFSRLKPGYQAMKPLFDEAVKQQLIVGLVEYNYWLDVGTPGRLDELRSRLIG